ncbi:MAG: hypothetical protein LBC74_09535 [Planctomycetaceae bacterium]|jgi:hypothetical protein|nr:hypothetical protein [Planctomycetaceae bacterium]
MVIAKHTQYRHCNVRRKTTQKFFIYNNKKIERRFLMKTNYVKQSIICLLYFIGIGIACLYLQSSISAGTHTVEDYTLTVSPGSPSHSPETPTVKQTDTKDNSTTYRRINANFILKIEKRTARGVEYVSKDVKSCTYEMDLSSNAAFYDSTPSILSKSGARGNYVKTNKNFIQQLLIFSKQIQ